MEQKNELGEVRGDYVLWIVLKKIHHGCFHILNAKAFIHSHLLHWRLLFC
jgi:hypothetical protein